MQRTLQLSDIEKGLMSLNRKGNLILPVRVGRQERV